MAPTKSKKWWFSPCQNLSNLSQGAEKQHEGLKRPTMINYVGIRYISAQFYYKILNVLNWIKLAHPTGLEAIFAPESPKRPNGPNVMNPRITNFQK